jgi:gamma-glutamylcyclotransferase (GGCT)/AIG2-like uncharacterized protein YtfP
MTDLLFVYGSLVSAVAHPMGEQLRREAGLLGAAMLQARLYRVSWYPGIALSDDAADIVHGELYRLTSPEPSLRWLDEYEGIAAGATSVAPTDDYERRICRVHVATGAAHDAWVYLYRRETRALERVVDGRWRG